MNSHLTYNNLVQRPYNRLVVNGFYRCILLWSFLCSIALPCYVGAQSGDTSLTRQFIFKSQQMLDENQLDSAIHYAKQALTWSETEKSNTQISTCLQLLGQVNFRQNNIPAALRNYLQALKIEEEEGKADRLIALHTNLAELYELWKVHPKAANHYQNILEQNTILSPQIKVKILEGLARNLYKAGEIDNALAQYTILENLYRQYENQEGIKRTLSQIIAIQKKSGEYEQALAKNQQLLQIAQSISDTTEIIVALNNIGVLYRQLNDYDQALNYFTQSIEFTQVFRPISSLNPTTLSNIGILYQNKHDYQRSLYYLFEAQKIISNDSLVNTRMLADINNLIAIVYLNMNDLENANFYNEKAIQQAKEIDDKDLLQSGYKTRTFIYEQFNDFEQALRYFKDHAQIRDSLQQAQQKEREQQLLKQFSVEQTEKEISLQNIDREVEDLKLKQDLLENERLRQNEILQQSLIKQERLEKEQAEQELLLAKQDLERQKAEQILSLTQQKLEAEQKDRIIDSLENDQTKQQLQLAQQKLETEQKDRAIAKAEKDRIKIELEQDFQLKSQRQTLLRNFAFGFLVLALIILGLIWRTSRIRRKANAILSKRKQEVENALSELQQTQTQLIQSEKMASLGLLTAGIAHEINNPVNFVKGNALALKRDFEELRPLLEQFIQLEDEPARTDTISRLIDLQEDMDISFLIVEIQRLLEGIQRGSERLKGIVLGMRTFSADQGDQFTPSNLHEGLDSTLTILQSKIKNLVEIHKEYGDIPLVECQFGKINQVFLNVLNNAVDAIQELPKSKQPGHIYLSTQIKEDKVIITIRDTGIGMDQATLKRIYEPFFTTKDVGKGTGLGMSISYGIIESHNGKIKVISQPEQGTTFSILLPIDRTFSDQRILSSGEL